MSPHLHSFTRSLHFYSYYMVFQLKERFTGLTQLSAFLLLYPFFIWLLTRVWDHFNASLGHYTHEQIYTYIAITECLFLNFIRSTFSERTQSDFSLSLSRPRSWLIMTWVGQFGNVLAGRIFYSLLALVVLPLLGVRLSFAFHSFLKLILLLPLLGVIEMMLASLISSARILWHEVRYLVLPITKIFLALGGVFGPLSDYGEPGRTLFLKLPASDLFFQVAHFCIKDHFYEITPSQWFFRIIGFGLFLFLINLLFYRYARQHHRSYGG